MGWFDFRVSARVTGVALCQRAYYSTLLLMLSLCIVIKQNIFCIAYHQLSKAIMLCNMKAIMCQNKVITTYATIRYADHIHELITASDGHNDRLQLPDSAQF